MIRTVTATFLRPRAAVRAAAIGALAAATLGAAPHADAGATPRNAPARHGESLAPQRSYEQALALFQAQRYAEAYGRWAELADRGDARAAWMALLLVANGPTLFGSEWSASPGQLRRWQALAQAHVQAQSDAFAESGRGE